MYTVITTINHGKKPQKKPFINYGAALSYFDAVTKLPPKNPGDLVTFRLCDDLGEVKKQFTHQPQESVNA